MPSSTEATVEEGYCAAREDQTHCVHWWDGDKCCSCGHGDEKAKEISNAAQNVQASVP